MTENGEYNDVVDPILAPTEDEELTRSEVINTFGPEIGRLLLDGGYSTIGSIISATDKELEEVPSLGRATVKKIREILLPPAVQEEVAPENVSVRVQRIRDSQQ